jgi:hypothetical protein
MTPVVVDASSAGHMGPLLSAILAVLAAAAFAAVWIGALVRAARAAALARAAARSAKDAGAPLAPGPAVIAGPVEMAKDETIAVKVEIDQEGTEGESSGSYSFSWTEKNRVVTMRPFYVGHASGARVRVEPMGRAYLVDAMDGMIVVSTTRRTRHAELSPGEHVFAVGDLQRAHDPETPPAGYRDAAQGWVLRPRPGEDMLLSSEPLEKRFLRRASAQRVIAWLALAANVAALAFWSPYFARLAWSRAATGTVLSRHESVSDDSESWSLDVRLPDGRTFDADVPKETYNAVAEGSLVPVRDVPDHPWATAVGMETGAHVLALILSIMLFVPVAVASVLLRRRYEAWYERPLVDSGSGRLEENAETTSM